MDFKRLDRVRRSATPVELDLVESYAQGRITRRQFIQRGTVIGLSMPIIGAVIAACGPGTASVAPSGRRAPAPAGSASAPPASAVDRRHDPVRHPEARLDRSGRDAGPGRLRHRRPVVRVPVHAADDRRSGRSRPGPRRAEWTPNEDGTVWTFKLRQDVKWQNGGGVHVRRRRRHDGAPRRGRQLRPQGRPRARWRGRDR